MERNMETTCRYYSKWLGQDEILLRDFRGIKYLYSEERNSIPFGYGTPFDLYVFCQKEIQCGLRIILMKWYRNICVSGCL